MMENPRLPEFDENSPLRPARFGHLVLRSGRFEEMVAFYKTFLNAEALYETNNVVFLTYDDEHHRILIGRMPNAKPQDPEACGLAHFAYLYHSLDELMSAYARLRDQGITPAYCVDHGFQFSLYYKDPDDNEVEIGCDNFQTRDEMNAWFDEGHFAKNVFGHTFDAEEVW
ncbi:MAG: VOC family protein, partial [Myxococcota bacterium]